MLLTITHRTLYQYDEPISYGLQRLRQTAKSRVGQNVLHWESSLSGAKSEVEYLDHFGNRTELVSITSGVTEIEITARGEVETNNNSGIVGPHQGFAPLWLYTRETELTRPSPAMTAIAERLPRQGALETLHALMAEIASEVKYVIGSTSSGTSAVEAWAAGSGVCQDHAHIFCAIARRIGFPTRYVSGFLKMDGQDEQAASHAWAEVFVPDLGWVGFDVSNGICIDERYVCVATGLDYMDAAPILGIRHGAARESLQVAVVVEQ